MKQFTTLFFVLIAFFAFSTYAQMSIEIPGLDINQIVSDEVTNDEYEQLLAQLTPQDQLTAPSLGDMQLAAKLAGASYCAGFNLQALADWKCKACTATGRTLTGTTAWIFAGYQIGAFTGYDSAAKVIRIAFRGSSNFANWMANLNFGKSSWGGSGQVHSGFKDAYLQTRTGIVNKIKQLQATHGAVPISITGHSLGGAVAHLCYLDLKVGIFTTTNVQGIQHVSSTMFEEPLPFTEFELNALGATQSNEKFTISGPLITFGQPRTGDSSFASYSNGKIGGSYFRVTHSHDPVPRIPTQAMGFAHGPQEIYFPNSGAATSFKMCSNTMTEDKNCIIGPLINLNIDDHLTYAGYNLHMDAGRCSP